MSSRWAHNKDLVLENRKMSSSISQQTNDAAIVEILPSEEEKKQLTPVLLKKNDEIYGPVLKLMKIFGMFFSQEKQV